MLRVRLGQTFLPVKLTSLLVLAHAIQTLLLPQKQLSRTRTCSLSISMSLSLMPTSTQDYPSCVTRAWA